MLVAFLTGSSFKWINESEMYNKIHVTILKQYMDDKVMYEFCNKNVIAFAGGNVSEVDIVDIDSQTVFLTCLNNSTDEIITSSFQEVFTEFLKTIDEGYSGKVMLVIPDNISIPSVSGTVACCQMVAEYTGGVIVRTISEISESMPADM